MLIWYKLYISMFICVSQYKWTLKNFFIEQSNTIQQITTSHALFLEQTYLILEGIQIRSWAVEWELCTTVTWRTIYPAKIFFRLLWILVEKLYILFIVFLRIEQSFINIWRLLSSKNCPPRSFRAPPKKHFQD